MDGNTPAGPAAVELVKRVFISFTTQDEGASYYATKIVRPALERAGLEVLLVDSGTVQAGDDWTSTVADGAAHSAVLVAVVSQTYSQRFWCMQELDLAMHGLVTGPDTKGVYRRLRRTDTPRIIPIFFGGPDAPTKVDALTEVEVDPPEWQDLVTRHRPDQLCHDTTLSITHQWRQLCDDNMAHLPDRDSIGEAVHVDSTMYTDGSRPHGHHAAEVLDAARHLVKLVVAAMHRRAAMEYDWQHVAELVAEATIPEERYFRGEKVGLWLQGDEHAVSLMVPEVCSMLVPRRDTHSWPKSSLQTLGSTTAAKDAGSGGCLPHFRGCAVVDLQSVATEGQQRSALKSILEQLGDKNVTVLQSDSALLARLSSITHKKAVILGLLNVASQEQFDMLVPAPDKMGLGSFVLVSGVGGSCPGTLKEYDNGRIDHDNLALQTAIRTKLVAPPQEILDQGLDGMIQYTLRLLPDKAQDLFFDVVSVLDDQPYGQVLALYNSLWAPSHQQSTEAVEEDGGAEAAFKQLEEYHLVYVDHSGRLAVHAAVKKLGCKYLCGTEAGSTIPERFQVGSRLWLQDGNLPGSLAEAAKVGVMVLAAKVDAVTVRQLARQKVLSQIRVLIITPSSNDNELPTPGSQNWPTEPQPQLQELRWLDLGCGVKDVAPWLQHTPNLLVLKFTEAKGYSLGAVLNPVDSAKPVLNKLRLPGMSVLPVDTQTLVPALEVLNVNSISHLRSLPESIVELSALKELRVQDCSSLQALPRDIGMLANLEVLDVSGCSSLLALPSSLGHLKALRVLDLTGCFKLRRLPQSVWSLRGLQQYWPPAKDDSQSQIVLPVKPPILYHLKPKQLCDDVKDSFNLLSIDGGGMRGLIPARVLEAVEATLKKEAWKMIQKAHSGVGYKAAFEERFGLVPDLETVKGPDGIRVDLADFFDVISGTSTGSILASYLATKGAYTAENILSSGEYSTGIKDFRSYRQQQQQGDRARTEEDPIPPGSAKAAQAMFVAAGPTIFPKGRIPLKRAFLAVGGSYVSCKHGPVGITKVLQQTFGQDPAAIRLSSSAADSSRPNPWLPALHTSLLVPTFHLDKNHAVLFWHAKFLPTTSNSTAGSSATGSQPTPELFRGANQHGWGFTTINRLQPPAWFRKCLSQGYRCRAGTQRSVGLRPLRPNPNAPTGTKLVFESSGDTLHVFCAPPETPLLVGSPPVDRGSTIPASNQERDSGSSSKPGKSSSSSTAAEPTESNVRDCRRDVLDIPLWEVVRASTAAPTFFPAHKLDMVATLTPDEISKEKKWSMLTGHFVDGGVVANNPTIAALSFLQRIYPKSNATNTAVLSLGCGSIWSSSKMPTVGGELFVAGPMVNIMMGANCDTATAAGEMLHRTARLNIPRLSDDTTGSMDIDSFLRIQAVAFTHDKGFLSRLSNVLHLKRHNRDNGDSSTSGPHSCHCHQSVQMQAQQQQQQQQQQPQVPRPSSSGASSSPHATDPAKGARDPASADPATEDPAMTSDVAAVPASTEITSSGLMQEQEPEDAARWGNYHMIGSDKKDQVDALQRMDNPDDWRVLLEIGAELAKHCEEDIKKWVRQHLLWLPDDGKPLPSLPPSNLRFVAYEPLRPIALLPY